MQIHVARCILSAMGMASYYDILNSTINYCHEMRMKGLKTTGLHLVFVGGICFATISGVDIYITV